MERKELEILLARYRAGDATEEEKNLLYQHYNSFLNKNSLHDFNEETVISSLKMIDLKNSNAGKIRLFNTRLLKVAAALLVISIISALYINFNQPSPSSLSKQSTIGAPVSKAIAILSSGDTIILDGSIADNTSKLQHFAKNASDKNIVVKTPRGGKIQLYLPDGSGVWLNSASTLTYSSSFGKIIREVSIEGEAYFEIAKIIKNGKRQAFTVKSNKQEINVLGTKFNVNNYSDDSNSITTLLEGSVSIRGISQDRPTTMLPGQQFVTDGTKSSLSKVNEKDAISWKEGFIVLKDQNFSTLARIIERNYDVKFSNMRDAQDIKLNGELQTNIELDELLAVLEINLGVKFQRDNTVIKLIK